MYWAVNLALSVGMLLGAAVATRSMAALFLIDAATSVACAVLIAARVPETRPTVVVHTPALRGQVEVGRDRPFVLFLGLYLAGLVVFGQWQLGLPLDVQANHGFGPSSYAILMALNCAGVVVLQPLLAPRLRLHDGAHLLALVGALFGLGYGVNAVGGSLAVYAVGTALWTVGEVVGFPVCAALVADLAPRRSAAAPGRLLDDGRPLPDARAIVGGELYGRFGGHALDGLPRARRARVRRPPGGRAGASPAARDQLTHAARHLTGPRAGRPCRAAPLAACHGKDVAPGPAPRMMPSPALQLLHREATMPNVTLRLNGRSVQAEVEGRTLLVEAAAGSAGLTGTHVGCDTSQCGACTVHVDGRVGEVCTMLAVEAEGAEVTTIEGLARDGELHPMQAAFHEHHGLQCGFCTPGMVMSATDL